MIDKGMLNKLLNLTATPEVLPPSESWNFDAFNQRVDEIWLVDVKGVSKRLPQWACVVIRMQILKRVAW